MTTSATKHALLVDTRSNEPGTADFRVVSANIQSFPDDALTLAEAEEDLRRNAAAGDLVLLQEIAPRYRPLVAAAFPASEWEVFYGADDNSEPIAYRRDRFTRLEARATVLHPPVAKLHFRRHITHLHLREEPS